MKGRVWLVAKLAIQEITAIFGMMDFASRPNVLYLPLLFCPCFVWISGPHPLSFEASFLVEHQVKVSLECRTQQLAKDKVQILHDLPNSHVQLRRCLFSVEAAHWMRWMCFVAYHATIIEARLWDVHFQLQWVDSSWYEQHQIFRARRRSEWARKTRKARKKYEGTWSAKGASFSRLKSVEHTVTINMATTRIKGT